MEAGWPKAERGQSADTALRFVALPTPLEYSAPYLPSFPFSNTHVQVAHQYILD